MAEKEEKGKLMLRCPRCENELPVNAKFCNHCGLSQTNPILVAIPQGQKDLPTRNSNLSEEQIPTILPITLVNNAPAKNLLTRNSNLSEEQIPTTPPIAQVNDTPAKDLPTRNSNLSEEQIPTTPPIAQVNDTPATAKLEAIHPVKTPQTKCGTTSHTRTLSLKARFTQNAAPAYIGKVVSVDRKPFRRNLLLTRAGLYITLVILTCLVIGIGFAIAYTIFHQTH
jgi:hypothetical protein